MTLRTLYLSLSAAMLLGTLTGCYRQAEFPVTSVEPVPRQVRGEIYNEVLLLFRGIGNFQAVVFNDIGQTTLTEDDLASLDLQAIAGEFGAIAAILNAPRFFVMDEIAAFELGATREVQGFPMTQVAVVDAQLADIAREPYQENTVARSTRYIYYAGNNMYRLISPEGVVYNMQSASREVDSGLELSDLETLGDRLALPEGWHFEVVVPEADVVFDIEGSAVVLTDDLRNAYQRE
jgi:hypothetical protein